MSGKNYQDLIAWQKATNLAEAVYHVTAAMPREELYGLTAQIRRAAVSVPANIAEGQRRRTDGEFLNQLSVAHGSVRELETHAILCGRLKLLHAAEVNRLLDAAGEVGRLVTGLANSLRR